MISGINSISNVTYHPYFNQPQGMERTAAAQNARQMSSVMTAHKVAQPEVPVQPVAPVKAVNANATDAITLAQRQGADPAEMAVRMRIQTPENAQQAANAGQASLLGAAAQQAPKAGHTPTLPGQQPGEDAAIPGRKAGDEAKTAQEVAEEGECQTCKERKYQDGSDDPGVSFKTPTNVDPSQAASAVRGHEMEHVTREQAKARQEDRRVVSQSVTYHTSICPECGDVYVSGGTTRTVTKANPEAQQQSQQQPQQQQNQARVPFSAVA